MIALHACGLSTQDFRDHLEDIYQVEVSCELISHVTNGIINEVREWQNRPLNAQYPIVYLDALRVNIREQGQIIKEAVYLALGVNTEGHKELLGLWIKKK
ncbi:MAG: hypothetical protein DWQ05_18650 [Calditrichaeota bacterium]|nr:MAG: hypothetical protein DWQ05_18650 [Calditrichota bacterium]